MDIQFNTIRTNSVAASTPIPIWTTMSNDLASLNTELSYMKISSYPITPIYYTTISNLVAKIEADYATALNQMDPTILSADYSPFQNQVLDSGVSPSGASLQTACAEAAAGNSQDLIAYLTEVQKEPQGVLSALLQVISNASLAFKNYKG